MHSQRARVSPPSVCTVRVCMLYSDYVFVSVCVYVCLSVCRLSGCLVYECLCAPRRTIDKVKPQCSYSNSYSIKSARGDAARPIDTHSARITQHNSAYCAERSRQQTAQIIRCTRVDSRSPPPLSAPIVRCSRATRRAPQECTSTRTSASAYILAFSSATAALFSRSPPASAPTPQLSSAAVDLSDRSRTFVEHTFCSSRRRAAGARRNTRQLAALRERRRLPAAVREFVAAATAAAAAHREAAHPLSCLRPAATAAMDDAEGARQSPQKVCHVATTRLF